MLLLNVVCVVGVRLNCLYSQCVTKKLADITMQRGAALCRVEWSVEQNRLIGTRATFFNFKNNDKTMPDQKKQFFALSEILKLLTEDSATVEIPTDSKSDNDDLIYPEPECDDEGADCLVQNAPMEERVIFRPTLLITYLFGV